MRRALSWFVLAPLLIPACGDDDDDYEPSSAGWAWILIETPVSEGGYTTSANAVSLGGSAFIRSENGGPTADVYWWNFTTGESGPAVSHFTYDWVCFLWYCAWAEVDHRWSATIPLAWGDNAIMVEARTNDYNWARARITVSRVPDTTPPSVWIEIPTPEPSTTAAAPTLELGGSAWDDGGLASVAVLNQTSGATATAVGTAPWTAVIALEPGLNLISVTATDLSGLTGSDSIEVTWIP